MNIDKIKPKKEYIYLASKGFTCSIEQGIKKNSLDAKFKKNYYI